MTSEPTVSPPDGFATWVDFAASTCDLREVETMHLFADRQAPTREAMRRALERELDIKVGDITADREFSLDRVACVGCCVLAPVVVIGEDIHARLSSFKVEEVLAGVRTSGQQKAPPSQ